MSECRNPALRGGVPTSLLNKFILLWLLVLANMFPAPAGALAPEPGQAVFGVVPGELPPAPPRLADLTAADKNVSTAVDWTFSPGTDFSNLGYAVSTVGDLNGDGFSDVALGAPNMRDLTTSRVGAVLVFYGSATGLPASPSQTLYGPHYASNFVRFGAAVSPAGDVNNDGYDDLLVGAPGYAGDGAAFVFLGSAGGLQLPHVWSYTFEDFTGGSAGFGSTVSAAGDIDGDGYADIIVGASNAWAGARGAARLFRGGPGGPAAAPAWDVMGDLGDRFAAGLAAAGDVNADGYDDIVVGSPGAVGVVPGVGTNYYGKVAVYLGGAGGLSLTPASILYGDQLNAGFGGVVSGGGDMNGDGYADVAVGEPLRDYPGAADGGRARVFGGWSGGLSTSVLWEEYSLTAGNQFGATLSPAGDVNGDGLGDLLIGSSNYSNGGGGRGLAAVATGSRTNAIFMPWTRFDTAQVSYAYAVATAGDVDGDGFSDILVGSWGFTGTQTQEGRVQMFRGGPDAPAPSAGFQSLSGNAGSFYGWAVAPAGDVNGDGYDDMLASAPNFSLTNPQDGLVVLFYGGPNGPAGNTLLWGPYTGSSFGYAVAGLGDVNGDGYDDFAVGAPDYSHQGFVSVWYGRAANIPWGTAPDWSVSGTRVGSHFGFSVAAAGDVNADGYADLVVGAPTDNGNVFGSPGPANEGKAYLYHGSATGLGSLAWSVQGGQADGNLGNSVSGAGDVNGDGFDDLIIGQEAWDQPVGPGFSILDVGRALIFHGDNIGMYTTPNATMQGGGNDSFGHFVANAGDVNGDGYGDVIVSSVYSDPNNQGSVAVFRGSAGGMVTTPYWSFATGQAFSALGSAVASAGDVNGDGLSDIVVGAVFHDTGGMQDNGRVWVFAGPLTGAAATTPLREWGGTASFENFGQSAAGVGDINGDGFCDIAGGSPGHTGTVAQEGRVRLFFGNNRYQGNDTLARRVQQRRGDDAAPLGLGGSTAPGADFRLRAYTGGAAGRADVRLEWQVAPQGTALGGAVSRGSWYDSAPSGAGSSVAMTSGPIAVPGIGGAHWRVRVAGRSPYFPHSPWISPSRNGRQEKDLRRPSYLSGVGDPATPPALLPRLTVSPNPFNPRTTLAFELPRAGRTQVEIFDVAGRLVTTLLDDVQPAGRIELAWDGNDRSGRAVASGTYFARATGTDLVATAKLTLVR